MLTCSSVAVASAILRQHPSIIMSSSSCTTSSKKSSFLLLFSLKQCVHKKLTTFQQCCVLSSLSSTKMITSPSSSSSSSASVSARKWGFDHPAFSRQDHHRCSLNLNNHITFHYINSSIVTSTIFNTTSSHQQHHHQPRCFIHHQSSSSTPTTAAEDGSIIITNYTTCNTSTHNNLIHEGSGGNGVVASTEENEDYFDQEAEAMEEEMLQEQVWSKGPALKPTFNVGTYANDSENVKRLLQLGVDLSKWESRYGAIPLLYKSNFETTMKPIIEFLKDLQVEGPDLSNVLSHNPYIFNEHVDNLKKRVEYLKVKKFKEEAIPSMITRNPYWLSYSVPRIDRRLGFFQTYFGLTGDQLRTLASVGTSGPKLITYHLGRVKDVTFTIKEEMGFTSKEMVKLLLTRPRIWREVPVSLRLRFDYLHNEEKFSHADFVRWPTLLQTREKRARQRIGFLKKLGRAQFDPKQPNYISPERLCTGNDVEWATHVARASVAEYNNYLKTL